MSLNKFQSYMGFAAKSRNIVTGYNTCILMLSKKKIKFLIIAEDLADNTIEKMQKECMRFNVPYTIFGKTARMSQMTGNVNKGIYGITDGNFAKVIKQSIEDIRKDEEEELL